MKKIRMFYIHTGMQGHFIIVSLNTEILKKPWKSIKVTLFHGWYSVKTWLKSHSFNQFKPETKLNQDFSNLLSKNLG